MIRRSTVAVLMGLLAASCTSAPAAPDTAPVTATSTAVVTASAPASASVAPSPSPTPSVGSSGPSAPASVAALDRISAAWFTAVCTGQKDLQKLASPQTSGTVPQLQAQVVAAYQALAASAARTASALTGLAAPTLPDGAAIKQVRIAVFRAVAAGYQQGAATITAARLADTAALEAEVTAVEQRVQAAVGKIAASAPAYPDGYSALISALPGCQGVA